MIDIDDDDDDERDQGTIFRTTLAIDKRVTGNNPVIIINAPSYLGGRCTSKQADSDRVLEMQT